MLLLYGLINITNSMTWVTFSPISDETADYFDHIGGDTAINMLAVIFFLTLLIVYTHEFKNLLFYLGGVLYILSTRYNPSHLLNEKAKGQGKPLVRRVIDFHRHVISVHRYSMEEFPESFWLVFFCTIRANYVFVSAAVVYKLTGSAVLELVSSLRERYCNYGM